MALLGVDIGTSRCKASVFSIDGTVLGSGDAEYPTEHPQYGYAQLASELVFERVCDSIRAAIAESHRDSEIDAMCFTAMGEAVVPVSSDRRILGPSILGTDTRGGEYVSRLTDAFDPVELYSINPNIPGPSYTMPKLCWTKTHEPDLYRRADHFLSWADCLPFLLGCEPVTNFAHANRTLLFDIRRETWSDELMQAAGLDAEKLPLPVPTGHVLGPISAAAARVLGLRNRPIVVVGAHDQCCNAVGAGAIQPGDAVCGIGTVECITPVFERIPDSARMLAAGMNVEHHAMAGRYVSFIYNQAGLLVRWFRDLLAGPRNGAGTVNSAPTYSDLMEEMPQEPSRLLVLPYFEPTGAPTFVSDAGGAIVGLTADTDRGRILKGIIEGETLYFVEPLRVLQQLDVRAGEITASGGGSRSDRWLQLKADILGVPVTRLETAEAGTLGAAIVAGAAIGVYASVPNGVSATVRRSDRFEPRPEVHAWYDAWHRHYQKLYPALADLMRDMRPASDGR